MRTDHRCYRVGQVVHLDGAGFSPDLLYEVTVDGVDFGQSTTNSTGGLSAHLIPGGLGAGVAQSVDQLEVSDGTSTAATSFTVTRQAGARFLATAGNPHTLRAPFEVWGFALDSRVRPVYLHYVSPPGHPRLTVALGHTGGACGYLLTPPVQVFPFSPSAGTWMLQLDSQEQYRRNPDGPVARIGVRIS